MLDNADLPDVDALEFIPSCEVRGVIFTTRVPDCEECATVDNQTSEGTRGSVSLLVFSLIVTEQDDEYEALRRHPLVHEWTKEKTGREQ